MKIALVAFKGTIAERVAAQVSLDTFLVRSSQRLIDKFVQTTNLGGYDLIVGMGVFTRPVKKVQVEMICSNVNGEWQLDTALADADVFEKAQSIGRSWCCLLACALCARYPAKQVAFLHIPSKANVQAVAQALQQKAGLG